MLHSATRLQKRPFPLWGKDRMREFPIRKRQSFIMRPSPCPSPNGRGNADECNRMPAKNSPTNVTGKQENTMLNEYAVMMRKG